jgi:hypothetical protein
VAVVVVVVVGGIEEEILTLPVVPVSVVDAYKK